MRQAASGVCPRKEESGGRASAPYGQQKTPQASTYGAEWGWLGLVAVPGKGAKDEKEGEKQAQGEVT